ncbi:STAS domain-containing protein [Streptosporangium longisporum]|uniref:STAS domain-containing protein n=1 Tax=Streptosporangium longisporum TaxID=46187 RepID=UPI0031E5EB1C
MTFFTISSSLLGTALVVRVLGELDYRHAPAFRGEMDKAWEAGTPSMVVVDVGEITFCDSTGVAQLVQVLRRSRSQGFGLALVGLHGVLERILTITGLRSSFGVFATVEEALESGGSASALVHRSPGGVDDDVREDVHHQGDHAADRDDPRADPEERPVGA